MLMITRSMNSTKIAPVEVKPPPRPPQEAPSATAITYTSLLPRYLIVFSCWSCGLGVYLYRLKFMNSMKGQVSKRTLPAFPQKNQKNPPAKGQAHTCTRPLLRDSSFSLQPESTADDNKQDKENQNGTSICEGVARTTGTRVCSACSVCHFVVLPSSGMPHPLVLHEVNKLRPTL